MEFHNITTIRAYVNNVSKQWRHYNEEDFYKTAVPELAKRLGGLERATALRQASVEYYWVQAGKPYYNVYPSIIPMLTRLDLDKVIAQSLRVPTSALCIRLPANDKCNPLYTDVARDGQTVRLHARSMLVSNVLYRGEPGFTMWIDFGERSPSGDDPSMPACPVYTYRNFQCKPDETIGQAVKNLPVYDSAFMGYVIPSDIIDTCTKLVCTLCLLGQDSDIIEPDVLACDASKVEGANDELLAKLQDKAKRRGKFGWCVGKKVTMSPHFRNMHPCIVHYGPGRTLTKIVTRKWSIVHRDVVERVPTGYEGILEKERQHEEVLGSDLR